MVGQIILLIMQPTYYAQGLCDPSRVKGPLRGAFRGLAPTAIHVCPLRGLADLWPLTSGFRLAACCLITLTSVSGQVNVLTYHNDLSRTGQHTNEIALTPPT